MARSRWVIDWPARVALASVVVFANVGGAAVVFVLAAWVLPEGPLPDPTRVRLLNLVAFVAYLLPALPSGLVCVARRCRTLAHELAARQSHAERGARVCSLPHV